MVISLDNYIESYKLHNFEEELDNPMEITLFCFSDLFVFEKKFEVLIKKEW